MPERDSMRGPGQRLGGRARAAMQLRRFSPRTQETYLRWMIRFHEWTGRRDPIELGAEQVTAFLTDLATREGVAASTQNQALAAILFLYRDVLGRDLPWPADHLRAQDAPRSRAV